MEPVLLTVREIAGDYAILVDATGRERQTALALLPEDLRDGETLRFQDFAYERA